MTDANGNPRQVASADATQLMRPLTGINNPVQAKPLDLPKASFGGYQPRAVEETVAELQYKVGALMRDREELNRVIAAKQTENGRLNQRITDLTDENKRLHHAADNPVEALGKAGQELINAAKGQADDIRAKVRAEAEEHVKASREQAEQIIAQAEQNAAATVQQALARRKQIDTEADARIGASHEQAERIIAQAKQAAAGMNEDAKNRAAKAHEDEVRARNAIEESKALLRRLLGDLES